MCAAVLTVLFSTGAVAACSSGTMGMPSPSGSAAVASATGGPRSNAGQNGSTEGARGGWSALDVEGVAALTELLAARSRALQTSDPAVWTATIADPSRPEGIAEVAAYQALAALGVRTLTVTDIVPAASLALPPASPGPSMAAAHSWTGSIRLGYTIPGFDRGPRWVVRTVRLLRSNEHWRIARWLADTDRWEPFDLAGLRVLRTDRAMVAGPVDLETLRARLDEVHRGQDRVAAVFGRAVPAVVLVPATAGDAAHLLAAGRSSSATALPAPTGNPPALPVMPPAAATLGQIAATTLGARSAAAPALADRVVLDPQGMARLTPAGRRVVLTHELTHVLVRASTLHDLPLWLSEGLAEWVAFRDEGMSAQVVAAVLLDNVRAAGAPPRLPTEGDFAGTTSGAVAAYQGAWLVVTRIGRDAGTQGVVDLVNRLGERAEGPVPSAGPRDLDGALSDVLGYGESELLARWQRDLLDLTRS